MLDPASVGVISNPASRHNARGGLRAVEAVLAAQPLVRHRLAHTPQEIEAALAELAAADVRCLALNGGDGTVQAALTMLMRADQSLEFKDAAGVWQPLRPPLHGYPLVRLTGDKQTYTKSIQ